MSEPITYSDALYVMSEQQEIIIAARKLIGDLYLVGADEIANRSPDILAARVLLDRTVVQSAFFSEAVDWLITQTQSSDKAVPECLQDFKS